MIGNDNGTVCIPAEGKHEPLSHINYCWIAKILELLSSGEKVNATPEQLLYLAKWLRKEIEKEKSETTKTEYVFYGLDGRNPQEEPTFDDFIQEGDKITVNEDGSRFNRNQLERVIVKQEEPVSKDLEEAASQYSFNIPSAIFNSLTPVLQNIWKREIEGAFIAGAKRHEKQIMNDAIEREVKEDAGGYPFIEATELYDYDNDKPLAKAGDKVKVVFIKDK